MNRALVLLFVAFASCKTSDVTRGDGAFDKQEVASEFYPIMVKFKALHAVKQVMYRLERLKLEVLLEVSATDYIYHMQLSCKPYEIDGFVEKIGKEEGVEWAKRVE